MTYDMQFELRDVCRLLRKNILVVAYLQVMCEVFLGGSLGFKSK
jgi:hypothetical protein